MLKEFTWRARTARGILDIGANAGLYTYHAAAVAPAASPIIAVEAISELADVINHNLARNGRENARAVSVAASDAPGDVTFYVATSDRVSSLDPLHVHLHAGATGSPRTVSATTIDHIAEGMEHIDLMKMDVEGHELAALVGAKKTLRQHRPTLLLEAKRATAEDARRLLTQLGYVIKRFDSRGLADVGPAMVPAGETLANFLCEPRDA